MKKLNSQAFKLAFNAYLIKLFLKSKALCSLIIILFDATFTFTYCTGLYRKCIQIKVNSLALNEV